MAATAGVLLFKEESWRIRKTTVGGQKPMWKADTAIDNYHFLVPTISPIPVEEAVIQKLDCWATPDAAHNSRTEF